MRFDALTDEPRLLMEVDLEPLQGSRFQPTGFPDLGAATYEKPDDTSMLLVESAQSMANRLEEVCWDEEKHRLVDDLTGLPYVQSQIEDDVTTNSLLEAHRLNSPFIVNSPEFQDEIAPAIGFEKNEPFDRGKLVRALAKYDINCLIHGVFLEKVAGTVRLARALSGFIEASHINVAASGGVKLDRVQPASGGKETKYGRSNEGYGNVPFHREEFTGRIKAYFNLDLAQIRGYGLDEAVEELLIALSLYKIRRFLHEGLRLRTACDLRTAGELRVMRPEGFTVPELQALKDSMPSLIEGAGEYFADPPVTTVTYTSG